MHANSTSKPSKQLEFLAGGYELSALESLRAGALSDEALLRQGAQSRVESGCYVLSHGHLHGETSR